MERLALVGSRDQTRIQVFSLCHYSQNMKNASFELVCNVFFAAEGFFAAVGTEDWLDGFACGTCAEVSYR